MKRKRASRSLNLQSEEGFVLIWTLYMIIPLVTLSFLFLMYSQSYNRKLDAQYYAMNITMSGTRSAEFDTDETVNNMAAFAHASGLTGAAPTRLWQSTANGDVAFVHDTESSRLHSVTTFLVFSQGVLGNMIDNATGVDVVGVSQAKPNPVLINLVVDYSQSLKNDFKIDKLLEAVDVTDGATNVPGTNGRFGINSKANQVMADDVASLMLPMFNSAFRNRRMWWQQNAAYPYYFLTLENCTPTGENGCSGTEMPHSGFLKHFYSDQFVAYKKAAVILAGVAAQASPYLIVDAMGGPIPDYLVGQVNFLSVGPDSPFTPLVNTGVFRMWSYDDPTVTGYTYDLANTPPLQPIVEKSHGVDDPKDPFSDNILMDLRNISRAFLGGAGYRKLIRYGTFEGATSGKTITPGQYSFYFDPPLPYVEDSEFNPPPNDSFVWNPEGIGPGPGYGVIGELLGGTGFPTIPLPLFTMKGPGHPLTAGLSRPVGDGWIYGCDKNDPYSYTDPNNPVAGTMVGPPVTNNAILNQDLSTTGGQLCLTVDLCDNGYKDNSAGCDSTLSPGGITAGYENAMWTGQDESPYCPSGDLVRCKYFDREIEAYIAKPDSGVVCIFGDAAGDMIPRCTLGGEPACYDGTDFSSELPVCRIPGNVADSWPVPGGHGTCDPSNLPCVSQAADGTAVAPVTYGTVTLPGTQAEVKSNLFYAMNDMWMMNIGTRTDNAIPVADLSQFQTSTDGRGKGVLILVTDGRPQATDGLGNDVISSAELVNSISTDMEQYTEVLQGKTFTWYLGRQNSWRTVYESIVNRLTNNPPANANDMQTLLDSITDADHNPTRADVCDNPSEAAVWNAFPTWSGCGVSGRSELSDILRIGLTDADAFNSFKAVMDDETKDRFWVETNLSTGIQTSGNVFGGQLNIFLAGLKNLIALATKGNFSFSQ